MRIIFLIVINSWCSWSMVFA